jgi:NADH-quinone oxidoreductase subunit F
MTESSKSEFTYPLTAAFRADGLPTLLDDYLASGGYEGLRRAFALSGDDVIKELTDSDVRGRGGAAFSAGRKWSFMLRGPEAPPIKYIACNADEMEPGSFKDRILMERSPHLLIEGMLIAGYATEATTGYIFVRGEYARVARILERALDEARAAGYLGDDILGSGFGFQIFVHLSAGRYMCGEASAMLNALEGKRANPRARPPHMTGAGLWGQPTVVNNVETLCCAPSVLRNGAQWWLDQGLTAEGGSKLYTLAGRVKRPGWWELPLGTPMREIIEEHAGGMLPGYEGRAIIPGGASSPFVAAADFDVVMDYASMEAIGSRLGTATMFMLDDQTCPVGTMANLMHFFAQESCGWCTPCREGLAWARDLLQAIEDGEGVPEDVDRLRDIITDNRSDLPFCEHSPGAIQPLESGLVLFADEVRDHIEGQCCAYRLVGAACYERRRSERRHGERRAGHVEGGRRHTDVAAAPDERSAVAPPDGGAAGRREDSPEGGPS